MISFNKLVWLFLSCLVSQSKKKRFEKYMAAAGIPVFETGRITGGKGVSIMRDGRKWKADFKKTWNHF